MVSTKKKKRTIKAVSKKRNLIGQGAYGCVYKPAFKCSSSMIKENLISKVMSNNDAMDEIRSYKIIDKIDPDGIFHIKLEKSCNLSKNNKKYIEYDDECDLELEKQNVYKNLQLTYGGKELYDYYQDIKDAINGDIKLQKKLIDINILYKILIAYKNIVDGIVILRKHKYCHFDIKLDNIVYDIKNNSMKLIDFGVSIKYNFKLNNTEIKRILNFEDEHKYFFTSYYETYPFELILLKYSIFKYMLKKNINKVINKIKSTYEDIDEDKEDINYILQLPILKNYIKLAKKLVYKYKNPKIGYIAFIKIIFSKLDLYSVGITLKKIIDKYDILYNKILTNKSNKLSFNKLKKLTDEWFNGVLEPQIIKRWTVEKSATEYNKIYEYCKTNI
jgi:serine/threonine protein kinase